MNFELDIIHWLEGIRTSVFNFFFEGVTMLGEEIVVILVLGVVYWCIDKKVGERLGLTLFVSLTVNSLLKVIVARPRPFVKDPSITPLRPQTAGGYSFPSGHTQSATTLSFGIYYFFKKKWLLIVSIIITLLIAISRMYLGVHYFTDVLVGGLLGFVFAYLAGKYLTDKVNYKKIYIYIIFFVVVALIVMMIINAIRAINPTNGFDAVSFYSAGADMAKMMAAIIGFVGGILFEKSKVNFENHNNFKKNVVRFVAGVGIILLIRIVLKAFFGIIVNPDNLVSGDEFKSSLALLFDFIRYFSMVFVGIAIYPMLFKKLNL